MDVARPAASSSRRRRSLAARAVGSPRRGTLQQTIRVTSVTISTVEPRRRRRRGRARATPSPTATGSLNAARAVREEEGRRGRIRQGHADLRDGPHGDLHRERRRCPGGTLELSGAGLQHPGRRPRRPHRRRHRAATPTARGTLTRRLGPRPRAQHLRVHDQAAGRVDLAKRRNRQGIMGRHEDSSRRRCGRRRRLRDRAGGAGSDRHDRGDIRPDQANVHDRAPKGKLNAGDSIAFRDLLLNRKPQFGKKTGKPVAYDVGTMTVHEQDRHGGSRRRRRSRASARSPTPARSSTRRDGTTVDPDHRRHRRVPRRHRHGDDRHGRAEGAEHLRHHGPAPPRPRRDRPSPSGSDGERAVAAPDAVDERRQRVGERARPRSRARSRRSARPSARG